MKESKVAQIPISEVVIDIKDRLNEATSLASEIKGVANSISVMDDDHHPSEETPCPPDGESLFQDLLMIRETVVSLRYSLEKSADHFKRVL